MEKICKKIIGIDIGGTNTDGVLVNLKKSEILKKHKTITSKENVTQGVKNCLSQLSNNGQEEDIGCVIIGTTHFINEIIQKSPGDEKLSKVALIRMCGQATYDFPGFSYISNKVLLDRIQGPTFYVDGGIQSSFPTFQIEESFKLNKEQIIKCIDKIMEYRLHNIAINSPGSVLDNKQELEVKQIIENYCSDKKYEISLTLSHEVCNREGLIYRENATILNECLKYLAQSTSYSIDKALKEMNLKIPFLLSGNNGSFLTRQESEKYPLKCFSASIVNSLKGGIQLYNLEQDKVGLVLDIGGTSTDMAIIYHGSARESGKHSDIGGVIFNSERMPMVSTIALGGGSIVQVKRNEQNKEPEVKILKKSIAKLVKEQSICCNEYDVQKELFLCNSDFAMYRNANLEKIMNGDKNRIVQYLKTGQQQIYDEKEQALSKQQNDFTDDEIEKIFKLHQEQVCLKINNLINSMNEDNKQIQILICGGGSVIVDSTVLQSHLSQQFVLHKDIDYENIGYANAFGATQFEVTQSMAVFNAFTAPENINEDKSMNWEKIIQELEKKIQNQILEQKIGKEPFITLEKAYGPSQYGIPGQINIRAKVKAQVNYEGLQQLIDNSIKYDPSQVTQQINPSTYNNFTLKENEKYVFIVEKKNGVPDEIRNQRIQENIKKYGKPSLTLKTEDDIRALAWGSGLFGCGGGGSCEHAEFQLLKEFRDRNQEPLHIYDIKNVQDEEELFDFIGLMGLPSLLNDRLFQASLFNRLLDKVNEVYNNKVKGVGDIELGGTNGLMSLLGSYINGIAAFDIHFMDRAFPRIVQSVLSCYSLSGFPFYSCNALGEIGCAEGDEKVEQQFKDYVKDIKNNKPFNPDLNPYQILAIQELCRCSGIMCISLGHLNKKQCIDYLYLNTYQKAYDVGLAMLNGVQKQGKTVQQVILNNLDCIFQKYEQGSKGVKILGEGRIQNKVFDRSPTGQDIGYLNIKERDSDNFIKVTFQNEYLIVSKNDKAIATTPDLITIVDLHTGQPIGSEESQDGLEVICFVMPSVKKSRADGQIQFYQPRAFNEDQDYIEY